MAISREDFVRQYRENHLKILGRPSSGQEADENYEYYLAIVRLRRDDHGIIEFPGDVTSDGHLNWNFVPTGAAAPAP